MSAPLHRVTLAGLEKRSNPNHSDGPPILGALSLAQVTPMILHLLNTVQPSDADSRQLRYCSSIVRHQLSAHWLNNRQILCRMNTERRFTESLTAMADHSPSESISMVSLLEGRSQHSSLEVLGTMGTLFAHSCLGFASDRDWRLRFKDVYAFDYHHHFLALPFFRILFGLSFLQCSLISS